MAEARRLLLWDVDQTLIEAGSVTKRAYPRAFQDATGMPLRQSWEFDGRTERAAVTQVLRDHGIVPVEALVDLFITRIVHELQERADELTNDGGVLPGATWDPDVCQHGSAQSLIGHGAMVPQRLAM